MSAARERRKSGAGHAPPPGTESPRRGWSPRCTGPGPGWRAAARGTRGGCPPCWPRLGVGRAGVSWAGIGGGRGGGRWPRRAPMESSRLPQVAFDSSIASRPLPGAVSSFWASGRPSHGVHWGEGSRGRPSRRLRRRRAAALRTAVWTSSSADRRWTGGRGRVSRARPPIVVRARPPRARGTPGLLAASMPARPALLRRQSGRRRTGELVGRLAGGRRAAGRSLGRARARGHAAGGGGQHRVGCVCDGGGSRCREEGRTRLTRTF